MIAKRTFLISLLAVSLLPAPAFAQSKIKVVASFSILADIVSNVGGDRVEVASLVAANSDAHVYNPSPADARKLAEAQAVFVNGLGFEGWLDRLVKASGTKAPTIVVTKGIKPLERAATGGHSHGRVDPHAWQSVANVKVYAANVRDGLIAADPAGKAAYEANAAAYLEKLDALDKEVRETIAKIPAERRRVLTTHDAFGYFSAAYGIEMVAPQGVSTESEPAAKDVAALITQIKNKKISGVFMENVTDPRLIQRISAETGAKGGGTLYSDALTDPKGPAPTYIDLIRHNIRTLSQALTS
ncbi:metal ABC transporter substrate-binding protein [Leptospira sp. severe_002]|uniref:metal ABC transporter substrate-binding protein n=1 Tax=Leptospira sp. severe_002 TaxID=2838237 RepID=UPI001E625C77|nr:metal ABC transporter substrate-binding protein [Leptospira sp. severe_002]